MCLLQTLHLEHLARLHFNRDIHELINHDPLRRVFYFLGGVLQFQEGCLVTEITMREGGEFLAMLTFC